MLFPFHTVRVILGITNSPHSFEANNSRTVGLSFLKGYYPSTFNFLVKLITEIETDSTKTEIAYNTLYFLLFFNFKVILHLLKDDVQSNRRMKRATNNLWPIYCTHYKDA